MLAKDHCFYSLRIFRLTCEYITYKIASVKPAITDNLIIFRALKTNHIDNSNLNTKNYLKT